MLGGIQLKIIDNLHCPADYTCGKCENYSLSLGCKLNHHIRWLDFKFGSFYPVRVEMVIHKDGGEIYDVQTDCVICTDYEKR